MPKELRKALFRMILSLTMLIVILVLSFAETKGWFSLNAKVSGTGMNISAEVPDITIDSTIKLVKTRGENIKEFIYKEDADTNSYFMWDEVKNDYILSPENEKMPLSITDLLPGEIVDLTFKYKCSDNLIGKNITIDLKSIRSDLFEEPKKDSSTTSVTHSVLGVFKVSVGSKTSTPPIVYEPLKPSQFLHTWEIGVADTGPTEVNLVTTNPWQKLPNPTDFKELTMRLEVDFTPIEALKVATNKLSEKSFSIGQLSLGVGNV